MERSFTLSARTKSEIDQWMRVFNLIIYMNKIGVSPMAENPYDFERRCNLGGDAAYHGGA